MRSRKLSPGLAVTRTTMRSESTRVPPVTALRSPPDSRITGADSPVIADSSIGRGAFEHLAVGRNDLAGFDDEAVPLCASAVLLTRSSVPSSRSNRA